MRALGALRLRPLVARRALRAGRAHPARFVARLGATVHASAPQATVRRDCFRRTDSPEAPRSRPEGPACASAFVTCRRRPEAAACYFPRDVFFCFFTFKLSIGALASVPRETGLGTRCFFDFPAMPILLDRGRVATDDQAFLRNHFDSCASSLRSTTSPFRWPAGVTRASTVNRSQRGRPPASQRPRKACP